MIYLSTNRVPHSVRGQRRLFGRRLRPIALITLLIWLFPLATCTLENIASVLADTPIGHAVTSAHAHLDEHVKPGTPEAPVGDCCDMLQSIPTLSSATVIPIPLYHFAGLTLALISVLWLGLFDPANSPLRPFRPPGHLKFLLISGSIWPNAPPR